MIYIYVAKYMYFIHFFISGMGVYDQRQSKSFGLTHMYALEIIKYFYLRKFTEQSVGKNVYPQCSVVK